MRIQTVPVHLSKFAGEGDIFFLGIHVGLDMRKLCLTRDARLTADPGAASSILAWSHTFLEIDWRFEEK